MNQASSIANQLTVWVDADACPQMIKQLLINGAERHGALLIFVAGQFIGLPKAPFIRFKQVDAGPDAADKYIAQNVKKYDLVITQDIPLAADIVAAEAVAINPRGEIYTPENIRARLSMRNFMHDLRETGVQTGGAKPFSENDRKRFADALEKSLVKLKKSRPPNLLK